MIDQGKHSVIGINVDAVDYQAAVARIIEAAESRRPLAVTAIAVHGVISGFRDTEQKYRLNQFDLVCPDGQPVRWALNGLHGCGLVDRVYGPQLMLRLCEAAAQRGVPIFLFGTTDEVLERLSQRLAEQFPDLRIAGREASKFRRLTPAERDRLAEQIRASGAGVCFVALGCPRQEVFVYEMRDRVNLPLVAVGAAFAFHAGTLAQAPAWMQRAGLEWLYRLIREPRRLWKRYATTNPAFAALVILQRLKLYSARPEDSLKPSQESLLG